jgi:hypothetical protein
MRQWDRQSFRCPLCNAGFPYQQFLAQHLVHSHLAKWKCPGKWHLLTCCCGQEIRFTSGPSRELSDWAKHLRDVGGILSHIAACKLLGATNAD